MKILIFDTETGGFSPIDNDILQLSYQVIECPSTGSGQAPKMVKEVNHYFAWPEDKSRVGEGAIAVNGLTEEFLATQTLSSKKEAMEEFYTDMSECDWIVAHNGDFDKSFITETARQCGCDVDADDWKPMIDTMKTTTELCKLPPHPGRTGYKWPKLIELATCLRIPTDDIDLHNSSADVKLTKRCFLHLLEKKFYEL